MTPERWQHINELFQDALDRSTPERRAFLDEVCAADEDSRTEVQSLIWYHRQAQDFLEVPALEAAAVWFAGDQEDSLVGTQIGSYKIEARLGAGGMGEVYLAEDTKLDRKVAIKFLARELEEDEIARRRQIREAKAAARLEHPNICGIHEVATHGSNSFIVMQYVEGETVSARMKRRPLLLSDSLDVAIQVADALSLAHSRGIIHRDIKPQNIMITPRGQVKVLDFGLAKMFAPDTLGEAGRNRESQLSKAGHIVGTLPYMSPEQAKGEVIDARSDLFSLGVVLYECVTGKHAFVGNTPVEICAQVIHVDPPLPSEVNDKVTPTLDRLILKALSKDRDSRYQSADELRKDLQAVRESLEPEGKATRGLPFQSREHTGSLFSAVAGMARWPRVLVPVLVVLLAALSIPFWWRATPYHPTPEALQWYQRGAEALRDGTYYRASLSFSKAIEFDDKFALAHARLAEAWSELDYSGRATRESLRANSLSRDSSPLSPLDSLYLTAITNVVLRKFALAIESYQKIAQQAPPAEKAQALVDLGRAQEKNDEIDKAIESYKQASELATQDPAPYLRLGIVYGARSDLESANQAFQTAESLYRDLGNSEGVAEVFCQRGFLLKNRNKLPEARMQLEQALILSTADNQSARNENQRIRTLLVLSSVAVAEGNPAEAEQDATRAIQLARDNGMENQTTNGLIWLGNSFLLRGELNEADKYYQQALTIARTDNGKLNEAWALIQLGSLREQQRNTDQALGYVEQALPFYRGSGYRKWLSQALLLQGRLYGERGEYEEALRQLREPLELAEQLGDLSLVASLHQEIGIVLVAQEQYPEALAHFDESCNIRRSLKATVYLGYSLLSRADALLQIGRFEEAKKALDEGAAIAGPQGAYKALLAAAYMTGARLELSGGNFPESKLKSHLALDLAVNQYPDTAAQAKMLLGLAETRSGGAPVGARLCEQAIQMAAGTGDPRLISSARLSSAEALLESGDAQRALKTALQAQETFARSGQLDSEWRAWLIAAQAKRRLGEEAAAREYASTAAARLSSLEQRFGSEAFNGYLQRTDVQQFRKQLDQLLNP